ncbi:MAG: hypothetical protein R2882_06275 [Gemmatimonadales bacterium]
MALAIDSAGGAALLDPGELASRQERSLPVEALQSHPALLRGDAEVPPEVSGLAEESTAGTGTRGSRSESTRKDGCCWSSPGRSSSAPWWVHCRWGSPCPRWRS